MRLPRPPALLPAWRLAAALFAGALGAAPATAPAAAAADPELARVQALAAELERDHDQPRALVPLVELRGRELESTDLARFAGLYARAADDREAHPEVRAYARWRLVDLERARGNLKRAAAELAKLGFLSGWQLAGPFDNEGKRGYDAAYPPEKAQDLAARFQGKAREVGWRALPSEALATGFAAVGAAVRPAREVVVYALTVVDAPREERARLYLGASGAVKVWVNGALVHADPTYHPARLDQAAVAFGLRPGPNRILVKLCHVEGRLGFYARLADARGEPLRLAARAPPYPDAPRASALRPEPVPGVVGALERRAAAARSKADEAAARRDLAVALAERRPGEERERRAEAEARRAAELAPGSLPVRLAAASLEHDVNRRRDHLEAAVRAHPDAVPALVALAGFELQRGRAARARELVLRARAAAPANTAARLLEADLEEQVGLSARAADARAGAAEAAPLHVGAVLAAARTARARDRLDEAARLLRKALALRFDDAGARGGLAQLLLDRGDLEGALRLLEEGVALDPADLGARLRLADLLAANGRPEEADEAYAQALRVAPEEPEILERRGQARLRAGRTQDALADFQAALELKPQNPQLKELVRAIEPARERFERPYLLDAAALARAAPAAGPDDDALVLGEVHVTKVYPSGLSSSTTQLVVKVLTGRGADAWRTWSTTYTPDRQELRIERARVLKPDGGVVETTSESDRSASEPWYRLYYDLRSRRVAFPSLAAGDLLELTVRKDDVAGENLLSDYFGELVPLAGASRKLRSDYVLLVPEGRRVHASQPSGVAHAERTLPGGVVEHRFSARDVPVLRAEPRMPGWSEVTPYVHVSTYGSWDEVARFYWGLVREQVTPTPEVRAVAERLAAEVRAERRAAGLPEEGDALALAYVQAAHRFVVTNTRYVGLEFGIHGYKPYRVDQILERRFGDCKDKASLTHALLEALGVDSRLVLLRMRSLGRIPEAPASLAVFNHAILYVPRFDLWLDGTASYSGSRNLPAEDRGASVLVVNPDGTGRFGAVPEGRAEDNATSSRYEIALAPDGSARIQGESRVGGVQAPSFRRAYAAENERRAVLEQAMSRAFPGLAVKQVAVSDLGRLEDEVRLTFDLELPRLGDRDGDGLRFSPLGGQHRFGEGLAPLSARRFDLVVGDPWESRLVYRYALPPGWEARELPGPVGVDLPFAAFQLDYRQEPGAVVAEARIAVRRGRVTAADYPAFRDFLAQLDRALSRPVRVGPAASTNHAAAR